MFEINIIPNYSELDFISNRFLSPFWITYITLYIVHIVVYVHYTIPLCCKPPGSLIFVYPFAVGPPWRFIFPLTLCCWTPRESHICIPLCCTAPREVYIFFNPVLEGPRPWVSHICLILYYRASREPYI